MPNDPDNFSLTGGTRFNNTKRIMITNLWKKTIATFNRLNLTARILTPLLLALAIPCQLEAAGPAPVNLLSTANFVILAGAAVTTTGGGIINGDVGASPIAGSAIGVTCAQVNGTIYAVDASGPPCAVINPTLLTQAKNDLTTAYNDAAGRTTPTATNPGGGNLGGLSLAPGLYKITTTTLITGSDLTLAGTGNANDVWIFQCAQDLQLGSGIKVILTGGAQAKNIFWQVGTSAVLGTFSVFNGTILASQAITMDTSSTMNGRALAFSAGVTFNGNGAAVPNTNGTATGIAVQQPIGTNLVNGDVTNNFGSVAVGTNTSLTFTITNTGSANLTGLGVTIDGANSTMFSVTTNPAASISPGGTTTFTVRFAPVVAGIQTATLRIANNDIANNNNPFNIAITGTGTGAGVVPGVVVQQPPGANLVNGVDTNNFGLVAVGAGTSLIFTITNIGAANLTVSNITIEGANSAMFTVTNLIATVSPGGSTNFTVRFAPASTGVKTAALHIANNDINNNPFNIALTGTGIDPAIVVSTNVSVVFLGAGISPTSIMLNRQTGLFTNSVLLANNSSIPIPAVRLYVLNLLAGVQVYYKSGSTTNGTPYVQYNFPLAPGATVDFTIEYYQASHQGIPIPTYVPEDTTAVTLSVTTNSPVAVDRFGVGGGGVVIGFYTTPGHSYAVLYGSDVNSITNTADPFIHAPINYVQWIDYGAPKTQSPLPLARFYRVFEQP
jgi:hypothetical protein